MMTSTIGLAVLSLSFLVGLGCTATLDDPGYLSGFSGAPSSAGSGGVNATGGAMGSAGTTTTAGMNAGGAFVNNGGATSGGATNGGQAGSTAQAGGGGAGPVPTDGKGLYDLNCKKCHGEQGLGTVLAPETQHPVRDYSNWVVRNGRAQTAFPKPMDTWSTTELSDAQLTLIWDYLDQPPQPTSGKALYDDYCANCHGADGKGGPTTRNIVNEVQNVLKQVRAGKNIGQYAMRHDSMPAFSTTRINDAELNLIHDYVDSF